MAGQGAQLRGKVRADELDALRERIREFIGRTKCSWADLAEAAGYGRDNPGVLIGFTRGQWGMMRKRFDSTTAALDSWPEWAGQGAQLRGRPILERDAVPSAGAVESLAEKARREAMERTEAMLAQKSRDGIPNPLNRAEWEAYWLAREGLPKNSPQRSKPISRQVA